MRLESIRIHPVKSTAIRRVTCAQVGAAGLVGDREWMVVDASGEMVSARTLPQLFRVVGEPTATGLRLTAPEAAQLEVAPLEVERPDAATGLMSASVFGSGPLPVRPAGAVADAWFRAVTGHPQLRLVHCTDPTSRPLGPGLGQAGDHVAFQDSCPVTVLSLASVARINDWMIETALGRGEGPPAPIDADRFRPNLVIDDADAPFAEDHWARIRIGGVVLRRAIPVSRCVMTTIDPADLSRGKEPIRTLARHRAWGGKTWAAVHFVPEQTGHLAVGDDVTVLADDAQSTMT